MPLRAVAVSSLLLNLLLALWLAAAYFDSQPSPPASDTPQAVVQPTPATVTKTNVVIRRQGFTWSEIESPDYHTYIANLRAIQCPESTIRDIIVAEIDDYFDRRRQEELVHSDHQWWQQEPDLDILEEALVQTRALEAEKKSLLNELLGPGWDADQTSSASNPLGTTLDGPLLGSLDDQTKHRVRQIEANYLNRRNSYLLAQENAGLDPDPAELARLQKEFQQEISGALPAAALEEYLLRYSDTAQQMRDEFGSLGLTKEEFRSIFRIRSPISLQVTALQAGHSNSPQARALADSTEEALQQVLGPDRYTAYKQMRDPAFRENKELAEKVGAPPEHVLPLYQITAAAQEEQTRIQNDPDLTALERQEALQQVAAQKLQSVRALLGEEAYQAYIEARLPPFPTSPPPSPEQ